MLGFLKDIFTFICRDCSHFRGYHPVADCVRENSANAVAAAKKTLCCILMVFLVSITMGPALARAADDAAQPDVSQQSAGTAAQATASNSQTLAIAAPNEIPGWPENSSVWGTPETVENSKTTNTITPTQIPGCCANSAPLPSWVPHLLGAQANYVLQGALPFHSPYSGPNSFSDVGGNREDLTQVYGVYLGSQLAPGLQLYIDSEMFKGDGLSKGTGLAGYVNGDVLRAGSNGLPNDPYIARFYLRYYYALGTETHKVAAGPDQLPGEEPIRRWEMKFGKLAAVDDFDLNRYANQNRWQFMNYDFLYNTSWDYAADTRGYSYGVVEALYEPSWRTVLGIYLEPNTQNGANFNFNNMNALGYNYEIDISPDSYGTVIRLLSFYNTGNMGNYDAALALAQQTGASIPNILAVEKPGGYEYGFGLNFEQPLADDGATGIFGRLGWNNGSDENWSYTECDENADIGAQICGVHWDRPLDRVGVAFGVDGLSGPHERYLAAGGIGMLLGDGKLSYGLEKAMETYYRYQAGRFVQVSPDFQLIQNPGYNKARGPVEVFGLRVRVYWLPL